MSDSQTPTDSQLAEAEIERLDPGVRAAFRANAKAAKDISRERDEALAKVAMYERQEAFRSAGVPLDAGTPGALLVKAYDGPNDAEAIKAEAAKYGILPAAGAAPPPVAQAQDDQQLQAEIAAQARISQAGAGAPPAGGAIDLAEAMKRAGNSAELKSILGYDMGPDGEILRSGPELGQWKV